MKLKGFVFAICSVFSLFCQNFILADSEERTIKTTWIDRSEVVISGDNICLETVRGMLKLKVIEYDAEKERYLVECIDLGDGFWLP